MKHKFEIELEDGALSPQAEDVLMVDLVNGIRAVLEDFREPFKYRFGYAVGKPGSPIPASRSRVYKAIDGERDYQSKWDDVESQNKHSVEEYIMYMEDYLAEAKHLLCRNASEEVRQEALHGMRKVTALGVACLEQHGAPRRET